MDEEKSRDLLERAKELLTNYSETFHIAHDEQEAVQTLIEEIEEFLEE